MDESATKSLGPAVLGIAWVFAALAIAVVGARFYVRLGIIRRLTVDDYIIVITFLLALGNNIMLTISASWGLGKHINDLASQPEAIMYTVKYVFLCEFFSIMSPGFGRISFAFLLLALVPPNKTRRRFLWSIIIIQFIVDVGTVVISFSQCRPIEGFWDHSIDAGCWPPYVQQYTGFVQGSVCSAVDLMLAVFPATLFWTLNIKFKDKLALCGIMGLGIFAMVASIVKTVKLQAISETGDITYAMAELAIWWTSLEAYLVLIVVSMPTLRPIFKTKRGTRQDAASYALNNTTSRKKPTANTDTSNPGSFERLYETPMVSNHISVSGNRRGGDPLVDEASEPSGFQPKSPGIWKDTTVSVSRDHE
ncbi:putative Integral membrane protein [Seiridium cardinale]